MSQIAYNIQESRLTTPNGEEYVLYDVVTIVTTEDGQELRHTLSDHAGFQTRADAEVGRIALLQAHLRSLSHPPSTA